MRVTAFNPSFNGRGRRGERPSVKVALPLGTQEFVALTTIVVINERQLLLKKELAPDDLRGSAHIWRRF
jgi:hypothetical protein